VSPAPACTQRSPWNCQANMMSATGKSWTSSMATRSKRRNQPQRSKRGRRWFDLIHQARSSRGNPAASFLRINNNFVLYNYVHNTAFMWCTVTIPTTGTLYGVGPTSRCKANLRTPLCSRNSIGCPKFYCCWYPSLIFYLLQ